MTDGLFHALQQEFERTLQKQRSESERNLLIFPSNKFHDVGHSLFAELTEGGFCTFAVTGKSSWDPNHHYYQGARTAAGRGKKIHRAFLLPVKSAANNPSLLEQLRLDNAAGITTSVLFVGDLISTGAIPSVPSLEFGIWDGEVTCAAISHEATAAGLRPTEWRISRRKEDVELYSNVRNLLLKRGEDIDPRLGGAASVTALEEPMLITAPIARELAPVLCKGSYMSQEDCSWYHSSWQFLRIFNMVSTPTWHATFYLTNLERLAPTHQHCLISGTADYSMLAHVLWAYKRASVHPMVLVLDTCETPLLLCKWYAKYVGDDVLTEKQDILNYESRNPLDIIVTDAFLTRFSPQDRPKVVSRWHSLLRNGGKVVTTIRIEPRTKAELVKASLPEISNFRKRASREASKWRGFLEITEEDVAELAQRYAERMVSFSCQSDTEIISLFQEAGFSCDIEIASVPGEMKASNYARVIAEKNTGKASSNDWGR
jgi:hypothetical protein